MRRFFESITAHPYAVLATGTVVALAFASFMLRLTRDTSPDAFIPKDHQALALNERIEEQFGLTEPIAVGVIRDHPDGIFTTTCLRFIQTLTRTIQDLPCVATEDVISLATESGVYFDEGIPGFSPLLREIPESKEQRLKLKDDILGYELYNGTLVAADGSAASILIRPPDEQQADAIYRALADLIQDYPTTDQRLVVAGEAAVRAHMGVAVSDDALRMNFICPIVMALLIALAYRTVRGTLLPLCVIGGAACLALGSMAASNVPIYIVTNGIFVIIMALGVADSLHLVGQYYEEQVDRGRRTKQTLIVDACMALWFPLLVTTLTDVAGFFALYIAGIMPPIRYFGLFTCTGVLGALLFSYTVVPAGLMIRPLSPSTAFINRRTHTSTQPSDMDTIGRWMGALGTFIYARPGPVLLISVAILLLAVCGASELIINDARILAFKDDHPLVSAAAQLNDRFDGTSHLNIIVTGTEPGSLIKTDSLRRIETLEAYTETLPHVGGTHSIAGWVKRAHQKMHDDDPIFYAIPEDEFDTQYYLDVLGAPTSPMATLLREVVDRSYTKANLIVRMRNSEFIHQRTVISALQHYLRDHFSQGSLDAQLAGRVNLDYHWLCMIRVSHINSVTLSCACVLVLTALMFRSILAGLLCTMTVGVAVLINYAVMAACGIPLGVGTSMFASIAIGAGVNFPIHMLDRLRVSLAQPLAIPETVFRFAFACTGRVLFFTAFVVAAGFLLLCVSQFRTLIHFGLLIGIAMIVSFATSVTLLPALVATLRPRFVWNS